jgi:hypothetical protein
MTVSHVRTPGGIVRMDSAEVEKANTDNPGSFEVVADDHADVKALYEAKLAPVASGGVPEGTVIPPLAGSGVPTPVPAAGAGAAPGSFTPAMTPEATWADPTNPNKFVMQIGSRWYVTDGEGHRFQKGQSAAGYGTQDEASAQATKMVANATAAPADSVTNADGTVTPAQAAQ